ncbi:MAG: aminotransferase class IV [Rhizonema sp. NSF051]|nr:aminotransferase class IV [Rhizonema sp. NSF051]
MFWYNGKFIQSQTLELEISDPGLLYGATVFTTLRVYDNSLDSRLTHWQAHCDRLQFSLQTFSWQQPDWQRLRQGAEIVMENFPVLRITIFPDGREWITGRLLPINLTENQKNGILALLPIDRYVRSLPSHKTGNYLSAWLAKSSAQQLNAQEAILVDAAGSWLETSTGNLWGWLDGMWWTPPKIDILPGVVRKELLNWLLSFQKIREEPWTVDVVKRFEAIAYTNSVVEVVPIHTVVHPTGRLIYNSHHISLQQLRKFFIAS